MKSLRASDIMIRPAVSARKNASARDVALQVLTGLYSGMPVTDETGKVIGVITELDLLEAVMKGKELVRITAGDIMSKEVITANEATTAKELIKIMAEKSIVRLPITNKEGKLVGIVARCDLLKSYIEPEFVTYM